MTLISNAPVSGKTKASRQKLIYKKDSLHSSQQSNWSDFESSVISFTAAAPNSPVVAAKAPSKVSNKASKRKKSVNPKSVLAMKLALTAGTTESARAFQVDSQAITTMSSESTLKQLQLMAASIETTIQAVPTIAAAHLLRLATPNLEKIAEEIPDVPPVVAQETKETMLLCPVTNSIVTSNYGMRTHPITGKRHLHNGVDFSAENNQPVHALLDGTVIKSGRRGALGIAVEIYHPSVDKSTIVGHLNGVGVKKGETISQGQVIGYAGSTGRSTGVHVHFMVGGPAGYEDPNKFLAWLDDNLANLVALNQGGAVKQASVPAPSQTRKSKLVAAAGRLIKPFRARARKAPVAIAQSKPKVGSVENKTKTAAALIATQVKKAPKVTAAQIEAARDVLTEKQRLAEMFEYLYKEGAVSRNQAQEQLAQMKKAEQMVQALEARKG